MGLTSTDFIILVFGILFLLFIYQNNKQPKIKKKEIKPFYKDDLKKIERIKYYDEITEKDRLVAKREFKEDTLKSMNIINYYDDKVKEDIPYDTQTYDYKFETKPKKIIEESDDNTSLRQIYNNSVKNYKELNPTNIKTKDSIINEDNFSYIDNTKIRPGEDIMAMNSIGSALCKY